MNERTSPPFQILGNHLRHLRERLNESLAEVSGAVEIDAAVLERIERGDERPSEDILMLLITHFGMQDQEAIELWELAGYSGPKNMDDISTNAKQIVMLVTLDARTVYTDGVDINASQSGIVMNFTQANAGGERTAISRVGMSVEQAENVSKLLQTALLHLKYGGGPKGLPSSSKK